MHTQKKAPSLCPTRGPLFPKTPLKGKIHHEKLTGCYKKNYQIANKNEKGVASRMFFFREGRSRRSGGDTSLLFLGIEGQIRPSGEEKRGFYFWRKKKKLFMSSIKFYFDNPGGFDKWSPAKMPPPKETWGTNLEPFLRVCISLWFWPYDSDHTA